YLMGKAKSLAEFKAAVAGGAVPMFNVMYADRDGNIFYAYNGAVPKRSTKFDWSKPVDGSNPEAEWQGYHTMAELPQLTNPKTGWMQNCNTTPFLLTSDGNPEPKQFPKYMVQEGDNPRGAISREILSSKPTFTFDDLRAVAFDTRVMNADRRLPALLAALKQHLETQPTADSKLREVQEELARWNHRSATDSIAMTIFSLWHDRVSREEKQDPIAALTVVIEMLQRDFGTWKVTWGELNRLQRRDES